MTTRRAGPAPRRPEAPQRATFLELFFDLAFVVALFQLSHGLLGDLRWSGAFQTLVLLLTVWLVWFSTALITDRLDPRRQPIQAVVLATLMGSLVMAAALPQAFGRGGTFFAGAFVAIQFGRPLLTLVLLGSAVRRDVMRALFWAAAAAVPWIIGALAHGTARGVVWALAVVVEYTALASGYPAPGLGRALISESPVLAGHLPERFRQFLIIALGELILVAGLTVGHSTASDRRWAFLVSIATTVLLWRIYIYRAGELLSAAIAAVAKPGRLAEWASYAHLVMVAGTVVTAVGAELVITHPHGPSQPAWVVVILGGPALFLAGRAIFEYTVFARVSPDRPIGILLLATLIPVTLHLPPLFVAVVATAVLTGVAIADACRARGRPPETPSPPTGRPRPRGG